MTATDDRRDDAPQSTMEGDRPTDPAENRVARWAGIALLLVGAVALGARFGLSPWAVPLVLVPAVVAIVAAEAGAERLSLWARAAALFGFLVLLGVVGSWPLLLVVLMIVLMVFLHELGHYLAARWGGMKATEFFLGFGTRIWSFRRGETEFGIKAIPAGAYVKIIGMNNLEEVDPADEARTYRQAPFRSRAAVAVAGSAMHFLIALVLLVVQFALIGRPHEERWTVGELSESGAAVAAGVREGDRLVSLGGTDLGSFEDFGEVVRDVPSGPTTLVLERDGSTRELTLELARRMKVIGTVGEDLDLIEEPGAVVVGSLQNRGRGDRAGLEEGDVVVAVDGTPVADFDDVSAAIDDVEGGTVELTLADGSTAAVPLGSAVSTTEATPFLGVGPQADLVTESLPAAAGSAVGEFGGIVGASAAGVATVFWPPNLLGFLSSTFSDADRDVTDVPTPASDVAISSDEGRPTSIVGLVVYGSDLTAENLSTVIGFLIAFNIFIGVFNLIPLLPFDGGHLAIAVYEKCRELTRRSSSRYIADVTRMIPVAYTVVMVLGVLFVMSVYLDLTRVVAS